MTISVSNFPKVNITAESGRVFLYGDTLTMDEIIAENYFLKQQLKSFMCDK